MGNFETKKRTNKTQITQMMSGRFLNDRLCEVLYVGGNRYTLFFHTETNITDKPIMEIKCIGINKLFMNVNTKTCGNC